MNRIDFADGLKAISMLYIVGFWHMIDYTNNPAGYHSNGLRTFTLILLSVFVLLAGYFSALQLRQGRGWRDFFASKVRGVYAPFLVALASCVAVGLFGVKWALGSALLYGMFNHQPPMTLWFICMLMLYFLASPIFKISAERWPSMAGQSLLFAAVLAACYFLTEHGQILDARASFYFPAYAFGLLLGLGNDECRVSRFHFFVAVAAMAATMPFSWGINAGSSVAGAELLPSLSGAVVLLAVFPWCWRLLPIFLQKGLLWFSGLSYFVYLFHRPIIEIWRKGLMSIGASAVMQAGYLETALVNMPLVLLVCHGLFTGYARLLDPWVAKLVQPWRRSAIAAPSAKG